MKPDALLTNLNADGNEDETISKIHVLQPEADVWSVIRELTKSGAQEEAFHVFDIGDVVRKHEEWKLKMPRVTPFYAMKCNDNPHVLKALASLGVSFDCATKREIAQILHLGVETERIIFANPVKQMSHIHYAYKSNVRVMTFDNEDELYKVKQAHPTAQMVLRIRCDAKKAKISLGAKFGALPNEAPHLMALAAELGIELIGISFHVGSGCKEPEVFERCITIGRQLFDLALTFGFKMTLLDLGGGYPGDKGTSIDEIAVVMNRALDTHFPEGCGVNIIAEPGTYYVASAFTLATKIIGKRRIISENDGSVSYFYYINDGRFKNLNWGVESIPSPLEPRSGPKYPSHIWGPTCDSSDSVLDNLPLPVMDIGDWIVWEDMGAYTLVLAGCFNGFPVPKVVSVAMPSTWLYLKNVLPPTDFVMSNPAPCKDRNQFCPDRSTISCPHTANRPVSLVSD